MEAGTARQLDGSKTIADLLSARPSSYADHVAVRHKVDGEWQDVTFAEVGDDRPRDRPRPHRPRHPARRARLVLCNTRPEWTYADFAHPSAGGVVVPIYPTNSPEECEWVAGNSDSVAVVCEDAEQVAKIVAVRERLPAPRSIVVIDGRRRRPTRSRSTSPRARPRARRRGARGAHAGGHARRPVHLHLHVGHHRPAEGLRADARQLPLRARHVREPGHDHVRRGSATSSSRSPTPSRCSSSC